MYVVCLYSHVLGHCVHCTLYTAHNAAKCCSFWIENSNFTRSTNKASRLISRKSPSHLQNIIKITSFWNFGKWSTKIQPQLTVRSESHYTFVTFIIWILWDALLSRLLRFRSFFFRFPWRTVCRIASHCALHLVQSFWI